MREEMPKEMPEDLENRTRGMAKALSMSGLFKAENYHEIVDVLLKYAKGETMDYKTLTVLEHPYEVPLRFYNRCNNTGLDDIDTVWLWEYLKNYNPELAGASDQKWVPGDPGNLMW